ncbi:16S rRNA (uracil(1498)-N(3))-methyltransferase [Pedobacter sp. PWIIR3]
MHVFYTPDIHSSEYSLSEEESKHCTKVLRLQKGAVIHLIDGRGGLYKAELIDDHKKRVTVKVIDTVLEYRKRNHYLHIAIAPTKNMDRLEWFLEKATEIGIDEITMVICARSERRTTKEERLYKVVTSAVKQSLQAYHPKINPDLSLNEFLKQDESSEKFIAHCLDEEPRNYLSEFRVPDKRYTILIGPEGDFSPDEIKLALQCGYKPVTLGNTRLRTETAGLAACFEVNYLNR